MFTYYVFAVLTANQGSTPSFELALLAVPTRPVTALIRYFAGVGSGPRLPAIFRPLNLTCLQTDEQRCELILLSVLPIYSDITKRILIFVCRCLYSGMRFTRPFPEPDVLQFSALISALMPRIVNSSFHLKEKGEGSSSFCAKSSGQYSTEKAEIRRWLPETGSFIYFKDKRLAGARQLYHVRRHPFAGAGSHKSSFLSVSGFFHSNINARHRQAL